MDPTPPPAPRVVLATDRLTLAPPALGDFADSLALWSDPLVTRYISGRPSTREEVWARLLRYVGHWQLLGFGYWVARERDTGRFVGEIGLADFRREITPDFGGAPEAGWVLAPWAHGRGLATEGVRAALGWADEAMAAPRIVCIVDGAHGASIAVARKCGFVGAGTARYKGEVVEVFERLRTPG